MHPWTRELHRQAMRPLPPPAPRTAPSVPREQRPLGWFSDSALLELKDKITTNWPKHNRANRKAVQRRAQQIEEELADRQLENNKE